MEYLVGRASDGKCNLRARLFALRTRSHRAKSPEYVFTTPLRAPFWWIQNHLFSHVHFFPLHHGHQTRHRLPFRCLRLQQSFFEMCM
jgi:hypothetical protein